MGDGKRIVRESLYRDLKRDSDAGGFRHGEGERS